MKLFVEIERISENEYFARPYLSPETWYEKLENWIKKVFKK
jgi:hypothetical protein